MFQTHEDDDDDGEDDVDDNDNEDDDDVDSGLLKCMGRCLSKFIFFDL